MGRINSYKNYTVKASPNGYATVTVSNSAIGLTVPSGNVNAATLVLVGNASDTDPVPLVYYTLNGETPTSTNGLPLYNGAVLEIFQSEVKNAKFIRATGNDQTLHVEFATVD